MHFINIVLHLVSQIIITKTSKENNTKIIYFASLAPSGVWKPLIR